MRVIPIAGDTNADQIRDIIWGFMLFPDDHQRAIDFAMRAFLVRDGLLSKPNDELVTLPAIWLKSLVVGDNLKDVVKGTNVRQRQGVTAGQTLLGAYMYAQTGRPVTLNRMIEVMIRGDEVKATGVRGIKAYGNKPEIHKAWTLMHPAAHLWAGLCLMEDGIATGQLTPAPAVENLSLGVAVALLNWATERIDSSKAGRGRSLIDRDSAWHLPAHYQPADLSCIRTDNLPQFVRDAVARKRGR